MSIAERTLDRKSSIDDDWRGLARLVQQSLGGARVKVQLVSALVRMGVWGEQ